MRCTRLTLSVKHTTGPSIGGRFSVVNTLNKPPESRAMSTECTVSVEVALDMYYLSSRTTRQCVYIIDMCCAKILQSAAIQKNSKPF